jgi:hypothetical protein
MFKADPKTYSIFIESLRLTSPKEKKGNDKNHPGAWCELAPSSFQGCKEAAFHFF